jgi:hypothetical protein
LCFLGSTIGNLHPDEVTPFLRRLRSHLADGDGLPHPVVPTALSGSQMCDQVRA